ncbi:MAG TPA: hypothetical protein VF808_14395 [Ktedonobacterales bacterium]
MSTDPADDNETALALVPFVTPEGMTVNEELTRTAELETLYARHPDSINEYERGRYALNVSSAIEAAAIDVIVDRAIKDGELPGEVLQAMGMSADDARRALTRRRVREFRRKQASSVTGNATSLPLGRPLDFNKPDDVMLFMIARMDKNVRQTGHPLHHRTAEPPHAILTADPALDRIGVQRFARLRGSMHSTNREASDADNASGPSACVAWWEAWYTYYQAQFANEVPGMLAVCKEVEPDLTKESVSGTVGVVGLFAHIVVNAGLFLHAERRALMQNQGSFDYRVARCIWLLDHADPPLRDIGDLATCLELNEWEMRVAEEVGLAGFGDEDTTMEAAVAAIQSALTYDTAARVFLSTEGEKWRAYDSARADARRHAIATER